MRVVFGRSSTPPINVGVVGVSGGVGTGQRGVPDFFKIDDGDVLFLIEGSAYRGVVGVARGVESRELNDGEGGSGAIVGVGRRTSGFGTMRLRVGQGGGLGNKESEKPALSEPVSSLE